MKIKHDPWQKKFLETKGDKVLCCGRQIGKSKICSEDGGEYAATNDDKIVLMIAPVERQSFALFDKTLNYLIDNYPKMIKKGKDRPTKTRISLTNGTTIWCLPVGISGIGVRFLTVHRLYVDEAAYIPEEVWDAVTPMLLTTSGDTIVLSTPAGRGNEFANIVLNKDSAYDSFTRFHENSEDVVKNRVICDTWTQAQQDGALKLLGRARARMSTLRYAQEYEGQLLDELRQYFPTELIKKCMTLKRSTETPDSTKHFLGVDVARMGEDESVLLSLKLVNKHLYQTDMEITTKTRLTETARRILNADTKHKYKKIYIDDGGLGGGVFDPLLEHPQTKRKVISINNASRSLDHDRDKGRKKKLLKEDLYNNLLVLMEQGRIDLFDNPDLFHSLKSIQAEETGRQLKIFGNYSHIAEALIRAAWCVKDKHLNIYIY